MDKIIHYFTSSLKPLNISTIAHVSCLQYSVSAFIVNSFSFSVIESYLEYNKRSIEFLEHFIVNITKQDIKTAFEKACGTFERSFKNFCRHKTGSNKYDKINYITLTLNNQGRIKKNECILSESG